MKIALDISQIVYEGTGVARFTYHLVKSILSKETGHSWTFFFSSLKRELNADIEHAIRSSNHGFIRWYAPPRMLSTCWNESIWREYMPIPGKFDVFLSSDWTQPPSKIAKKRATVVHDLIFKKLPDTVDPLIVSTQTKRLSHVVRECGLIWCDSKSTAADLKEYYPNIAGNVVVNYPGVTISQPIHTNEFSYNFQQNKYFFAVGKIEPRKNLQRLVHAFLALVNIPAYAQYHLVIAGPRGWDVATQSLEHPQIHLLGQVTDDELAQLYQNATAFVFPSLYEGFGIPPLEAMSLGCPVIMSNASSLPEIAPPEAALFIDPTSEKSITTAMKQIVDTPHLRKSLIAHGKTNASCFTYDKYLQNMLESVKGI